MHYTLSQRIKKAKRRFTNIFSLNPKSVHNAEQVEAAEHTFYEEYLREGMTVFDVGSNIGTTAAYFGNKVSASGAVHCFEPGEFAFRQLKLKSEQQIHPNLVLNNVAVGACAGISKFHIYPESHSSWNSVERRPLENYGIDIQPDKIIEVPMLTLDDYCQRTKVNFINLLKLDSEGFELQGLQGARKLLEEQRIGACVLEFGQTTFDQGNSPRELLLYLKSVGYDLRNLIAGDPIFPGGKFAKTAQFAMLIARPSPKRRDNQ